MSEFKGTPGPWVIRYGCVNESDEGFGISPHVVTDIGIIAECWPCTTTLDVRRKLAANARLIAAAPELLAALQGLSAMYVQCFDTAEGGGYMAPKSVERFEAAHKRAETAIAKALD